MTAPRRRSAILSGDEFVWAVGIEDTFIPQLASRTGRMLDEYELTQHYRFWREDLALAASLGLRHIRYGIPWYRVNPEPDRFDWSWTDPVLEYMVRDLRMEPIVDLVHYGCPLWLDREFINPDYPRRVADYAAAFVERYRGLTHYYTPLNEPLVNTRFCGYTAQWPPYLSGWRGYVRVLVPIAHGMSLTVAAIRDLQPDATIVHVEATAMYSTEDPSLEDFLRFTRRRQFLPGDLLLGRVDRSHPLRGWLLENGASEQTLDRLEDHPEDFEITGINFYPGISAYELLRREGVPGRRRYYGGPAELEGVVRAYHEHYGKPVMISETSTRGPTWRRERWMDASLEVVRRLRGEGRPVIGYTWWPLFSLVGWDYRKGRNKLATYLVHMGLWDLREDEEGRLLRVPTYLVDRFRARIADTASSVGGLGPNPALPDPAAVPRPRARGAEGELIGA